MRRTEGTSRKRVGLYISKLLWDKFIILSSRDHDPASAIVEGLVSRWVQEHDPGNPQRPLTAWAPGHPDEEAKVKQDHFSWLKEYAGERRNQVTYKDILIALKEAGVPPPKRPDMADDLAKRLSKEKVRVLR